LCYLPFSFTVFQRFFIAFHRLCFWPFSFTVNLKPFSMNTPTKRWHLAFTALGVVLMLLSACKKDDDNANTVKDIDGNTYKTVKIGSQVWMADNLRATKYNDGTSIPTGYNNEEWVGLTTGGYAIYPHSEIDGLNSDAEILTAYGALYNWYAVETGKLCPTGWRVPTDAEWITLTDYAGGESVAGGKLKSTRTAPDAHPRWEFYIEGATNEYGFSALPGGNRQYFDGNFGGIGYRGNWWSSNESHPLYAWVGSLHYGGIMDMSIGFKEQGNSVRCIKDQ